MDIDLLQRRFARMGARVKVGPDMSRRQDRAGIDIRTDADGEFFDIRLAASDRVEYEVVDLRPDLRHLLLLARRNGKKEKFLCGHDERHWFVCAVPGASVAGVAAAMQALQPPDVRRTVSRAVKREKNRFRRRNEAFVRQGEWFFVPVPNLAVNPKMVFRNEPISRGRGSKPHLCQYLYRIGGETVQVCSRYPRGVTPAQYEHIVRSTPGARKWNWSTMRRDPSAFARGRVWHPDHRTVVLDDWHRVLMNTEGQAPGAKAVVFLD